MHVKNAEDEIIGGMVKPTQCAGAEPIRVFHNLNGNRIKVSSPSPFEIATDG